MDSVGAVLDRKAVRPLIRFTREAVDIPGAVSPTGVVQTRDVEYVHVTPPYSKDEVVKKAKAFFEECAQKVGAQRMPREDLAAYQQQYDAWKQGLEIPLVGTPIRGWPVLSPAQQENLIRAKIPTVEYLSEVNEEGLRAIGMGGTEMKRKAVAWLAQAKDKGPLTLEIAAVRAENDVLRMSVETLTGQVALLMEQARDGKKPARKPRED